ncbi:MAG: zf-TFIIB domain-containing protein [Gaiellaceae bacterium]|jgi:Zn-finger nucleic acid-binding protein
MNCPACDRTLTTMTAGPITVDACSGGCGGIWFDHFELKTVDEKSEAAGEMLLDIPRDASLAVDLNQRRTCPKCGPQMVMMRHFTSVAHRVTIDECPNCGGIWLDAGELKGIRSEFASDEARHQAAEKVFSEMFDTKLAAEEATGEAELERAQRFAHAFRFICPSTYLPGRQEGGAF